MNFERITIPQEKLVTITINTVDTNLEYERELNPNEATKFITELRNNKRVSWRDSDTDDVYYLNTNNIISIDVSGF